MVMNRSHFKNPFSMCCLKIRYLHNHRQYLNQINQPDNGNKERHLHHKCAGRHKAAQSQRAGISHKNSGRIDIKQEKSQKTSYNSPGNGTDSAVFSQSYNGHKGCHQNRYTGTQAVKTVSEVYSIVCSQHDKKQKRHK